MLEEINNKFFDGRERKKSNSYAMMRALAQDRDAAILIPRRVDRASAQLGMARF
mgnify:CR=1 FL=1